MEYSAGMLHHNVDIRILFTEIRILDIMKPTTPNVIAEYPDIGSRRSIFEQYQRSQPNIIIYQIY